MDHSFFYFVMLPLLLALMYCLGMSHGIVYAMKEIKRDRDVNRSKAKRNVDDN